MTNFSKRAIFAAGVSVLAGGIASSANAAAFYLQEQSVRGAGRAFSGEVADQGAASLWWNPASIGGMTGGAIYNGDDGGTYKATITPIDADHLKVRGCIVWPLCKSQTWTRVR